MKHDRSARKLKIKLNEEKRGGRRKEERKWGGKKRKVAKMELTPILRIPRVSVPRPGPAS